MNMATNSIAISSIAISSTGPDLNSQVDQRFGRCPYFVLVNKDGEYLKTLNNSAMDSPQGAGISTAQLLVDNKVDTVLVGRIGPKAIQPLQSAGINIFSGISGTVKESVASFKNGNLSPLNQANSAAHGGGQMRGGRGR